MTTAEQSIPQEPAENHDANLGAESVSPSENSESPASQDGDDVLAKLQAENAELKDKYLRLYADFENFRKRTAKEKLEMRVQAQSDVLVKILEVVDVFDLMIKNTNDQSTIDQLMEGIHLVHQKVHQTLDHLGVKPMNATGTKFDDAMHEGITTIPAADDASKGLVIDELRKGYTLHDKTLRFAQVVIGA